MKNELNSALQYIDRVEEDRHRIYNFLDQLQNIVNLLSKDMYQGIMAIHELLPALLKVDHVSIWINESYSDAMSLNYNEGMVKNQVIIMNSEEQFSTAAKTEWTSHKDLQSAVLQTFEKRTCISFSIDMTPQQLEKHPLEQSPIFIHPDFLPFETNMKDHASESNRKHRAYSNPQEQPLCAIILTVPLVSPAQLNDDKIWGVLCVVKTLEFKERLLNLTEGSETEELCIAAHTIEGLKYVANLLSTTLSGYKHGIVVNREIQKLRDDISSLENEVSRVKFSCSLLLQ